MDTIEWGRLVKAARRSRAGMEALLAALEGYIRSMATKLAVGMVDEGAQAGRVAIWSKVARVDLDRPDRSIRGWLLTTAANAIRDEVRKTQKRRTIRIDFEAVLSDVPTTTTQDPALSDSFRGLLRQYLTTIRRQGSIAGVRSIVAARRGVSPACMSIRFREAANEYIASVCS